MRAFPNRPMKFWEVISGFGDCTEVVRSVLKSPRWKKHYAEHLENFDTLVRTQRREILDQFVPLELSREICEKCKNIYVLWPDNTNLMQLHPRSPAYQEQKVLPKLSALEVHDRYGPAVLEEVHEKGSATVA